MASLTLRGLNDRFPEGTSLGAYPLSNWPPGQQPAAGTAPVGSATATASVSSDAVTLTGLADDTAYIVTDSSGTKFVRAFTSLNHGQPVKTDTNGKVPWDLLAGSEVNVKDAAYWNASDHSAAINAAITAAGSTRAVKLPAGTYNLTSRLDLTSAVTLIGEGQGKTIVTSDGSFDHLRVQGSKGANLTVASNVAAAATTIVLSDASSLAAGDYILISSGLAWPGGTAGRYGEVVRIKSIATNTLTLYGAVDEAYATADTAVVNKLTMPVGVRIEGITFQGVTNSGVHGAIQLTYCRDALVDNCEFRNLDNPGFQPNSCVGWVVRNSSFRDLTDNTGASRLGYGVNANGASRDGRVEGCYFENCRHGFTTSGSAEGVPRHIVVADSEGRAMSSATFDSHEEGRYISFFGLDAHGSASGGFQIRAPDSLVEACSTSGINDTALRIAQYADRARVRGGTYECRGASSAAITVAATDAHFTGTTVTKAGDRCFRISSGGDRAVLDGVVLKSPAQDGANSECLDVTAAADVVINDVVLESATTGVKNVSGTNVQVNGYTARSVTTPLSGSIVARLPRDQKALQIGLVVPDSTDGLTTPGAVAVVSATQYYRRFVLSEDLVITKLGFYVINAGSAIAGDTVDVGILASNGTTIVVSAGSTTGKLNATGIQTVTVASTRLKANTIYYAAILPTIATVGAFTIATASSFAAAAPNSFGAAAGQIIQGKTASVGPALSTAGIAAASNTAPLIWLLES